MEMFNEMKRRLSFTEIIMKIILITLILYYKKLYHIMKQLMHPWKVW